MNAITTIAALHLKQVGASTCNTRLRSLAHPSRRGRTAWPPPEIMGISAGGPPSASLAHDFGGGSRNRSRERFAKTPW